MRCGFTCSPNEAGTRVDAAIAGYPFPEDIHISRSMAQQLIEAGQITVNGNTVKSKYALKLGDVVEIEMPELEEPQILAEDIPLDVLYEDEHIIVVNKPRGMVVHPAAGHYTGTLVNALMFHCRDSLSGINGVLRPGIVHRIDMDTSGLIVAAKTNEAHISLSEQFQRHSINRVYHGIAFHVIKQDELVIDMPIGRHPKDRKKHAVYPAFSGVRVAALPAGVKEAYTTVTVLERMHKFTYFKARLRTGRTHQIRVHMAYKGYPLLGDMVYGPVKQPFQANGQILHAMILGFEHPTDGRYMEFCAELPGYFTDALERVGGHG